ncbi:23S rRNA (uracil(1939)-C(5))-methyltransferase RlmD [Gemmatimonadota bacterium]|nr:23S rRNA (uracil(1939)-C(5))-methyltransferase RlmD [Gemmatimonadota bacterium]
MTESPMTETMMLEIDSIAVGGDGVARQDGLVVFVPRTAPGDRVVARIERGKRFARGIAERVEQPSPSRTDPSCAHYLIDHCGGCQLQHMTLDAQHEAKRGIIRDSLRRIGKRVVDAPPLRAGTAPWRYRHRLSLAIRRRADGSWFAGMHAWHDPSTVFDLRDCLITDERVVALWREVLAAADALPEAAVLRGTVRLVGSRGAFVLEGGAAWPRADQFAARLSSFDQFWWIPAGGRRQRIGPQRGDAGPHASFSQVNPSVAEQMEVFVAERVMAHAPTHVIDAYAGTGDRGALLQTHQVRVTAVELDEEAAAYAATRLQHPSRSVTAKVEDVIAALLPADLVVLNPPRAGVDERVTAAIEAASPPPACVIYVSCDPATLARDIARMPSWDIRSVTAFDMFPQTAHVETVVELVPRERAASPGTVA